MTSRIFLQIRISKLKIRLLFQYPIRSLIISSTKVLKPWDSRLDLYDCPLIWQPPGQQYCWCVCLISKQCNNVSCQSRGFEALRHLTIRCRIGYWNEPRFISCFFQCHASMELFYKVLQLCSISPILICTQLLGFVVLWLYHEVFMASCDWFTSIFQSWCHATIVRWMYSVYIMWMITIYSKCLFRQKTTELKGPFLIWGLSFQTWVFLS